MSSLLSLAEQCEAAAGVDRRLDGLIWQAIEPEHDYVAFGDTSEVLYRRDPTDNVAFEAPPPFTASLDAAMTLVPEGWGIAIGTYDVPKRAPFSRLFPPDYANSPLEHQESNGCATMALALCAAALRTRSQME